MSLHALARKLRKVSMRARAQRLRLIHPGIQVGHRVRVGKGVRLFVDRDGVLILGDGCEVDDGATIAIYGRGRIELGPGSFVGHRGTLAAHSSIVLGRGAFLAELVSVRDHDHLVGAAPSSGIFEIQPVTIGADVWIGSKATLVRGAWIGNGTVVGANAVVRGELPPRTVCGGIPAKVIRRIEGEMPEMPDQPEDAGQPSPATLDGSRPIDPSQQRAAPET
jgi:acetyltransferase-like isoleucine patch superfamily enzyme